MSDLDDIIRSTMQARSHKMAENITRNNALLATLMNPATERQMWWRGVRYRWCLLRERVGEVIAGRKFDDWGD